MWRKPLTPEGSAAKYAAVAFGASLVLPVAILIGLAGTIFAASPTTILLLCIAFTYIAQIILLDQIERFGVPGRRRIWLFSAVFHGLVLLAVFVAGVVWSWAAFAILIPEIVGAALVGVGIRRHAQVARLV